VDDQEMATLNVKNLPDALYRRLQARAKRQRRSVAQEVAQILSDALATPRPVSILELRGLGKEHWKDIEATRHVEDERATWD
jgi:plasmid stability protein